MEVRRSKEIAPGSCGKWKATDRRDFFGTGSTPRGQAGI